MTMQDFYLSLGENIRIARKKAGYTPEQIGVMPERSMSRTAMVNIEQGRQQVSAYQLKCFADNIGVSVESLLPRDAKRKTQDDLQTLSAELRRIIDKY